MNEPSSFTINGQKISQDSEPYFIADIAANHDGELSRAIDLIHLAAEAGAHAAKFQHFSAATLVSDEGFQALGNKLSHQASWKKSVYEIYEDASINLDWTAKLAQASSEAGIAFMSTPYSLELADHIDDYVEAYKIGSGDITYTEIISHVAATKKPWLIATGAATIDDVRRAIAATGPNNSGVLMQCNTNYTASKGNFKHINLNVLKSYKEEFPHLVLGLSDHTLGHSTVLGAIALGARVFEKHFTDDNNREGPDHGFSMNPVTWREMCESAAEVFESLGTGAKQVQANELDTVVLQRRCIRARRKLFAGEVIEESDLIALRPAPKGSILPFEKDLVVGSTVVSSILKGSAVSWDDLRLPS